MLTTWHKWLFNTPNSSPLLWTDWVLDCYFFFFRLALDNTLSTNHLGSQLHQRIVLERHLGGRTKYRVEAKSCLKDVRIDWSLVSRELQSESFDSEWQVNPARRRVSFQMATKKETSVSMFFFSSFVLNKGLGWKVFVPCQWHFCSSAFVWPFAISAVSHLFSSQVHFKLVARSPALKAWINNMIMWHFSWVFCAWFGLLLFMYVDQIYCACWRSTVSSIHWTFWTYLVTLMARRLRSCRPDIFRSTKN